MYSENAIAIYSRLYYSVGETSPTDVHRRVSRAIGMNHDEQIMFFDALEAQAFRPNTPCLINAKVNKSDKEYDNNLAACFVVGLDDKMESIIDMWTTCANVYAGGGGVGIPLSNLREKGASISTGGHASGPISYLKVVQSISDSVKSGGKSRRAANLTSFKITHPDIMEYIECKDHSDLSAVNISVLVPDEIMEHIANDSNSSEIYELVSPTGKVVGSISIGEVWQKIIRQAHKSGDPGLLFYDESNRRNAFPSKGEILSTNPCLPAWALVHSKTGYKLFSHIEDEITILGETKECTDYIETSDDMEVYSISLESGIKTYMTLNHIVSTNYGDVELGQITDLSKFKIAVDYTYNSEQIDIEQVKLGYETYVNNKSLDRIEYLLFSSNTNKDFQLGYICSFLENNISIDWTTHLLKSSDAYPTLYQYCILILSSFGIYSELKENTLTILESNKFYNLLESIDLDKLDKIKTIMILDNLVDESCQFKKIFQNIVEIKSEGNYPVYDIKVPDGNYFVSGTAIVHNCGEVTLPDFSMCDLGSINLEKCLSQHLTTKDDDFDFSLLIKYAKIGNTFLDNVIDKTSYPNSKFQERMLSERPVGLGIMGFSNVLFRMGIQYGSPRCLKLFEDICKTLTIASIENSIDRAEILGSINIPKEDKQHFINRLKYFGVSDAYIKRFRNVGIRNSTWTSIAPTGSISISADTSYAFEPEMALIWSKKLVDDGRVLYFTNALFEAACKSAGVELTEEIKNKIAANKGSCQNISEIPQEIRNIFVVAHDVGWKKKIDVQAVGQRYISLAISSTCNLPNTATIEDVHDAYIYAWKLKLKGITVYRDGSISEQPVNFGGTETKTPEPVEKSEQITEIINKRPMVRLGKTIEVNTPHGKLYLTGNVDSQGNIFEVFLNMGKQGHISNILLDALSRVMSKALQYGMPVKSIIHTMKDCGGLSFFTKLDDGDERSEQAQSIIDAIAMILDRHFNGNSIASAIGEKCPNCGEYTLTRSSGCRGGSCPSCGYSSCQ